MIMRYAEIKDAMDALSRLSYDIEVLYVETDGEVTEETEALEAEKEAIADLLTTEGVDALGRWLKSKEDELRTYKAEKEAAARRIKSVENTIDFVKETIHQVMVATGQEKLRGAFYGFSPTISKTTKADSQVLKDLYLDKAVRAIHDAGIPDWVGLTLTASVSAVPEGEELPEVFVTTERDSVRFTKPRIKE